MSARIPTYVAAALDWLLDHDGWRGAREGISGTTLAALADRGLAEWKWVETPHRRMVGRLTDEGRAVALERRRKAAQGLRITRAQVDRLEGLVLADTHPDRVGYRLEALATIELLRGVAVPS